MEKIKQAKDVLKGFVILGVVAILGFAGGRFFNTNAEDVIITSELLKNRIEEVSELATLRYEYTNMGKFEQPTDLFGWEVPFMTRSFVLSYEGEILAGVDLKEAEVEVKGNKVEIVMPKAEIIAHEIDENSVEVFDETKNIFNQIQVSDMTGFMSNEKAKVESEALEKGLLEEANQKAESAISMMLEAFGDELEVSFVYAEAE